MQLLLFINIVIAVVVLVILKRQLLLAAVSTIFLITFINDIFIQSTAISLLFLLTTMTLFFVIAVLTYKKVTLKINLAMYIVYTIPMLFLIPLLLTTSKDSVFLSTAYLSVSVFIIGLIIFTLGITKQTFIYDQYIKHPIFAGLALLTSSIVLTTLFMPYFYLYILWYALTLFVLYKTYIKPFKW